MIHHFDSSFQSFLPLFGLSISFPFVVAMSFSGLFHSFLQIFFDSFTHFFESFLTLWFLPSSLSSLLASFFRVFLDSLPSFESPRSVCFISLVYLFPYYFELYFSSSLCFEPIWVLGFFSSFCLAHHFALSLSGFLVFSRALYQSSPWFQPLCWLLSFSRAFS